MDGQGQWPGSGGRPTDQQDTAVTLPVDTAVTARAVTLALPVGIRSWSGAASTVPADEPDTATGTGRGLPQGLPPLFLPMSRILPLALAVGVRSQWRAASTVPPSV